MKRLIAIIFVIFTIGLCGCSSIFESKPINAEPTGRPRPTETEAPVETTKPNTKLDEIQGYFRDDSSLKLYIEVVNWYGGGSTSEVFKLTEDDLKSFTEPTELTDNVFGETLYIKYRTNKVILTCIEGFTEDNENGSINLRGNTVNKIVVKPGKLYSYTTPTMDAGVRVRAYMKADVKG